LNLDQLKPRANLVVVLPVCRPDHNIACKWLRWARWLNQGVDFKYDLVVFCAASLEPHYRDELATEIRGWDGAQIQVNPKLEERTDLGYGYLANLEFLAGLEMTERLFPGRPTLWTEPDCIPTRPTWVREIDEEYSRCGMPFMGDFHALGAIPHLTGNAVYAADWRKVAPSIAALPGPNPAQGWDTSCSHETLPQSHRTSLIQQAWIVPPPRFTEKNVHIVHRTTALFHRCKDGSLIDVLSRRMGGPEIPLGPSIARPVGTVQHRLIAPPQPRQIRPLEPPGPKVEIMLVGCRRDADFLEYALKSIERYAQGFAGTTLVIPNEDIQFIKYHPPQVKIVPYKEQAGKGFLHHMIQICRADEHCPKAEFILHMDCDNMFWQPTRPEDFVSGGKCLMVRQHYDEVQKLNRARLKWRECVKAATGYMPEYDTMVRHPNVYPRALYWHVRNLVEQHTRRPFNDYVFDGQDKFPQTFCEFVTLGNIGLRDYPEMFNPVDYDHERDSKECGVADRRHQYIYRPGRDKLVEFWSHGGISKYRNDCHKFLRGALPRFYLK
jgi:hypothetical protein